MKDQHLWIELIGFGDMELAQSVLRLFISFIVSCLQHDPLCYLLTSISSAKNGLLNIVS